jgi:hypothetical protein
MTVAALDLTALTRALTGLTPAIEAHRPPPSPAESRDPQ